MRYRGRVIADQGAAMWKRLDSDVEAYGSGVSVCNERVNFSELCMVSVQALDDLNMQD